MKTRKKARVYRTQDTLFKNWLEKKGRFCPVCGGLYITSGKTGVSTYYVHTDRWVCEVRNEQR